MTFFVADASTVTAPKNRAVRQKKRDSNTSSTRQSSTRTSCRNEDDMDDTAFQAVQSGSISRQGYEVDSFVVDSEDFSQPRQRQRQQQSLSRVPASSIPDPDFGPVREVNGRSRNIMNKPRVQKFHSINAPLSKVSDNLTEDFQEQCYDELRKTRNNVRYN